MTPDLIFKIGRFASGTAQKNYLRKKRIVEHLYNNKSSSNPELCKLINSTAPSVSKLLKELKDAKVIKEVGFGISIGGRRPNVYAINPPSRNVVGLYIDREEFKVAVFDLGKNMIGEIKTVSRKLENSLRYINDVTLAIKEHLAKNEINMDRILGVGVSIPGLVNSVTGQTFTNLTIGDKPLTEVLQEKFNFDVVVENDARVMALAEQSFGSAKDISNAMCIIVGHGVGMGMIIDGKIYQGQNGFAGEFGHIQLDPEGLLCECGKIGCLETVASGKALVKSVKKELKKGVKTKLSELETSEISVASILKAAKEGDTYAISKFTEIGENLGKGIAVLLHLLNPGKVVIGGEYSDAGQFIVDPVMQALNKYAIQDIKQKTEVVVSDLGRDAALLGTLPLVMNKIFADTDLSNVQSI
jgi:glucokinase-like ROK family protein